MVASRILAVLAILAAMPCAALAAEDEEVVTASHATKMPTAEEQAKAQADAKAKADIAAKPVSTQDQITAWLANAPALDRPETDTGLAPRDDAKAGPRQIHGEAGVSIGTGGYRSAYVSTLIPVGENGMVGLAYSETDFGRSGAFGYGGYGGYGYGARGYGYGGYGVRSRGGSSKSVALSLGLSDDASRKSDTPEGCAPGFRDGGRYVEPLWVSRMHAGHDCDSGDPR